MTTLGIHSNLFANDNENIYNNALKEFEQYFMSKLEITTNINMKNK